MRRRDLIAGLLLVPFATPAMAAVKQISILHSGFPNRTPIHVLIDALRARGYEDGTAAIELLGAEGDAQRLDTLVTGLVSKKPDVIIALTSPAVLALKRAGVVTPVVFAFVTDPVRQGIVASLAHPGGNFTGVTYSEATLGGKRLDLLLDALPGTRHIAVSIKRSSMSPIVQVFGRRMTNPSTRSCGRRPKSAKARNCGTYAGAVPRALWGFCRGFGLAEAGL